MKSINIRKLLSLILAISVAFIMVFSIGYTVLHAEHHCDNDKCPICLAIHFAENTLKLFGAAIVISFIGIMLLFCKTVNEIRTEDHFNLASSLLALKVKFNN